MSEEDHATGRPVHSWRYSIDPGYDPDGAVPPYAVIGAWPVGEDGGAGEFVPNPGYRPSVPSPPPAEPTDPVDGAMQRAAAGQGTEDEVLEALAGAAVYLPTDAEGGLTAYEDDEGRYVAVLTAPRQAPPSAPQLLQLGPEDLLRLLDLLPDGTALWINPESDVSLGVSGDGLRAALRDRVAVPAAGTPPGQAPPPGIPRKGRDTGRG